MQWVLIARSPAAVQSRYSQFTGRCAPRAARPSPSHPRGGRRVPGPVRAQAQGPGRLGPRSREPQGAGRQPPPPAAPAAAWLPRDLSPIRVPVPRPDAAGPPAARQTRVARSLPARGAGVSNKPLSTPTPPTPLGQRGRRSAGGERRTPGRSLRAPSSRARPPHGAVRVRVPPARRRAARAIFRDARRVGPFSPRKPLFSFFLTTLRKVISHGAAA